MDDSQIFLSKVSSELELLKSYFKEKQIAQDKIDIGLELEFHLLDNDLSPSFNNLEVLNKIKEDLLVPEITSSVVEVNSDFFNLESDMLKKLHTHLYLHWKECLDELEKQNYKLCSIGTLPTFTESGLDQSYVTKSRRNLQIQESISRHNQGSQCQFNLKGENLINFKSNSFSFMGATSAQHIHLRVPFNQHADYYNASLIASGLLIALSSNSPYFLSSELWHESRILIFEQVNQLLSNPRVFFGERYLSESFIELFEENMNAPVIVFDLNEDSEDPFGYLKHHNSTIWRWNRPILDSKKGEKIHLRIENRVLSAAPSMIDAVANTALYLGLVHEIVNTYPNYRSLLTFDKVSYNFYQAARYGIHSHLYWFNNKHLKAQELLLEQILPMAISGLNKLKINNKDITYYMEVIESRVKSNKNPSDWQKETFERYDGDFQAMLSKYNQNQLMDKPVYSWNN